MRQTVERFGRTPVAHLDELGILDGPTVLAHCVHLSDDDIARIRRAGAAVLHNPLSNLKLGSGIAPIARLLEEGIPVALGTDGPVSSNDLDMWTAMRFAGLLQRGVHMDPVLTPAHQVVRMATTVGAEALGLGERLAEGYRADLRPRTTPPADVRRVRVYAVGRDDVRSVMIDGCWVMRDRALATIDEAAVLADMAHLASRIEDHAVTLDRA